jgi:hypothetical protein
VDFFRINNTDNLSKEKKAEETLELAERKSKCHNQSVQKTRKHGQEICTVRYGHFCVNWFGSGLFDRFKADDLAVSLSFLAKRCLSGYPFLEEKSAKERTIKRGQGKGTLYRIVPKTCIQILKRIK